MKQTSKFPLISIRLYILSFYLKEKNLYIFTYDKVQIIYILSCLDKQKWIYFVFLFWLY